MRVFDAHVHFWDPIARQHDWLASVPSLRRRFGPDDLDPGPHELAGVIFVQADCLDAEALDEVQWVVRLAAGHPVIHGIVAYAPLHRGHEAEGHLRALVAEPLVVGVRRLLQRRPVTEITDAGLIAGVRMLPEFGLAFDVCVTYDQLTAVAALAGSCPETTFVLDHLGKPPVASREARSLADGPDQPERLPECSLQAFGPHNRGAARLDAGRCAPVSPARA